MLRLVHLIRVELTLFGVLRKRTRIIWKQSFLRNMKIVWLNSVVYVCFGSHKELNIDQIDALAGALEKSGVDFIWCVKEKNKNHMESVISKEYEDHMVGRGLIIRGWAPQVAILRHKATSALLTHCGWNSTLEGLAAGVVMLTGPMGVHQFISERLIVNELGVGIKRVCEGETMMIPEVTKLAEMFVQSDGENGATWIMSHSAHCCQSSRSAHY